MRSPLSELGEALADLDDLAHEFVAEHVAGLHGRHLAVHQVEVRAADGAGRHLDDDVAGILDLRIGNRVAADVALAVPAQCLHGGSPRAWGPGAARGRDGGGLWDCGKPWPRTGHPDEKRSAPCLVPWRPGSRGPVSWRPFLEARFPGHRVPRAGPWNGRGIDPVGPAVRAGVNFGRTALPGRPHAAPRPVPPAPGDLRPDDRPAARHRSPHLLRDAAGGRDADDLDAEQRPPARAARAASATSRPRTSLDPPAPAPAARIP